MEVGRWKWGGNSPPARIAPRAPCCSQEGAGGRGRRCALSISGAAAVRQVSELKKELQERRKEADESINKERERARGLMDEIDALKRELNNQKALAEEAKIRQKAEESARPSCYLGCRNLSVGSKAYRVNQQSVVLWGIEQTGRTHHPLLRPRR